MTNAQELNDPPMVRCEVTGQMLPEDETVVINGMRVSAEGKALLMEQMRTGEAMPGEIEAPGSVRRWACAVVDGLILSPVGMGLGFLAGMLGIAANDFNGALLAQNLAETLTAAICVIYFTLLHGFKGQSLGKMLGKFRVTRMDGSAITMGQAFVRALMFSGVGIIGPIAGIVLLLTGVDFGEGGLGFMIVGGVTLIVALYWIANVICVLAHPQKRALHDLIAGTRAMMIEN